MAAAPRAMPRLLKATYLADQEYLLEETRGTKLYYFPGPILWTLVFGVLTLIVGRTLTSGFPDVAPDLRADITLAHYLGASAQEGIAYAILFLFLIGLLWLLVRYVRWISTVYAVTSRRVILQKGIIGKDFDEIPVTQVRGVDVHQSAGQRILGYGTVRISSEGGRVLGNEDWLGVPKPFRFQKLIENATYSTTNPAPPATPAPPPWPPR